MSSEGEGIGGIIIIGLIIWGVFHFFSGNNEDESYKNNPEVYSKETRQCIEPENPYDEGSGHYAGYEWGEQGNSCGGNSSSFIEGCEMFEELDEAFAACEDAQ
ncbi:hypothetical protein KA057_02215 [Candidatus Gracilibacteria bacterium]|nr:hypothetical protein [Candidatus Gracilibacteria bacterium]